MGARGLPARIAPVLVLAFATASPTRADLTDGEWKELKAVFEKAFVPLPVSRIFADLEKELRESRRDPYSAAARGERTKAWKDLELERERVRQAREARRIVVDRLAAADDARAHELLLRAYDCAREDVDRAASVFERHFQAGKTDINPGVDPGGIYWKNWVRTKETWAAWAVKEDEEKLRDVVLEKLRTVRAPAIRDGLVGWARSHKRPEVRCEAARALASSGDPASVLGLLDVLAGEKTPWVRTAILDALAVGKPPRVEAALIAGLRDEHWPARAAAVSAIRAMDLRTPETVDALLERLAAEDGRLRHDLRDALADATGQAFGLAPDPWRRWWADNRAAPPAPAARPPDAPPEPGLPSYYGIPFASRRVAFLISYSGCMATPIRRRELGATGQPSVMPPVDTRYRIALWELAEAFRVMPETARFTVILYGSGTKVWSLQLQPATHENTEAALAFAHRVKPDGGAVVSDALEAVFRVGQTPGADLATATGPNGVDTVFVIGTDSDASTSFGERPGVTADVRRINRLRRVLIHSVVLGTAYTDVQVLGSENGGQSLRFQ